MQQINAAVVAGKPVVSLLIVDDNAQLGASLVALFRRCGFTAATVRNGRSALEYLSRQRVDILITDIFMPNGDGLELLYELYKQRILLRVVAMTGGEDTGMPDMLQVATLMGAECTIPKPFEPKQLIELVRGMLSASALANGTGHGPAQDVRIASNQARA